MERYARQVLLEGVGKKGQEVLRKARVVVVGVGALGSHAAELLVRAGVGHVVLVDRDSVELSNLNRQVLFCEEDVGLPKAVQAVKRLRRVNSTVRIEECADEVNAATIHAVVGKPDVIVDCSDNMEMRYLVNEYAMKYKIPWVYGGAIQERGNVLVVLPGRTPCFSCVFPSARSGETCDTVGVLNTITSLVSSLQVSEVFKILLGRKSEASLVRVDLKENTFEKVRVKKRKDCAVCNGVFEVLERKESSVVKFCSSGNYQFRVPELDLGEVAQRLKRVGDVVAGECFVKFENMLIFKTRVLVKADSEKNARSALAKYVGS